MQKKKMIRGMLFVAGVAALSGVGYGIYLWNIPHRDVQASSTDYEIEASALVEEYLSDAAKANEKYLRDDGDSKILTVCGIISSIEEDMNEQKVVVLKSGSDKAGVSCTFTQATNGNALKLKPGDHVRIKGVIRAGAGYDVDLELFEDVILEKCDLVQQ